MPTPRPTPKVSYLKAIDERIFDYQRVERTDTHARRVGDTVLVTGRARMDVAANGRQVLLNARYSMVWVRKDEFDHFGLGPTGAVRHATHSLCHVIAQLDR